jgi:O-antigen/teichoic acid export membrane protein
VREAPGSRARTADVVSVGAAAGDQDGPGRLRAEDDQASLGTSADRYPVQTKPSRQASVSAEQLAAAPSVDTPDSALQAGGRTGKRRWRAPPQLAGRLSWGLADQAVSSLTNAAIGVYVVRTLGAEQFGAFSLAYVTYGFALNASRGLATDPLMVRFSGADLASWRRAVRDCTGTAAVVGLVLGLIVAGASAFLPGTTRMAFLALGLTLPGLMLQDSWRYAFFALGRGSQAFLNDLVWAGMLALAMGLIAVTRHQDVFYYVLAWGATAAVAASLGPVQSQVVPRLLGAWAWLSQHRDLGTRYLLEGTSGSLSAQLRAYGVDAALGLTAVATMSAANTLMGPMTILLFGMALVTLPEAARILKRSPRRLPVFCTLLSGGMAAVGLLWGVVLLIALPRGLGAATIGPIWKPTYPLVLPQTVYVIGTAVFAGAGTGLHALGAARRSLRTTLIGTTATLGLTLAGAVEGGVLWSVYGLAAGAWLSALIAWWQLRIALRESRQEVASEQPKPAPRRAGRHHRRPAAEAGDTSLAASGLSIGEVLFYARRRAGLTVGQLSHRTGIEGSVIGGIERNDYSACGGDFYARVYIRSMARVVGTDPAPLVAEYDGDAERPDETDEALLGTNTLALILPTEHSAAARRADSLRGRGWTRIWLASITVLILLAAAAAYLYHRSEQVAHRSPGAVITHSASPAVTATTAAPDREVRLQPASISAYGHGGPRYGDHIKTVFFAIDGNPATAWQTNWYATPRFGGLKAGTGLVLDLGRPATVTSMQIVLAPAQGAAFEVRVGDSPSLAAMHTVARSAGSGGAVALRIARPARARFLLIWFTRLPRDAAGTYQEAVYDMALTGR